MEALIDTAYGKYIREVRYAKLNSYQNVITNNLLHSDILNVISTNIFPKNSNNYIYSKAFLFFKTKHHYQFLKVFPIV